MDVDSKRAEAIRAKASELHLLIVDARRNDLTVAVHLGSIGYYPFNPYGSITVYRTVKL